jgi:hypothetical protein
LGEKSPHKDLSTSPLNQILLGALEALYNNFVGFPEKCLKAVSDGMGLSRTTGIHTFDSFILSCSLALVRTTPSVTRNANKFILIFIVLNHSK